MNPAVNALADEHLMAQIAALTDRARHSPSSRVPSNSQQPTKDSMMKLSPARQKNAVSEGIAFGLALCDRNAITAHKTSIDLAFTGAWRSWAQKNHFPYVTSQLEQSAEGMHVITHAGERKHTFVFFWEMEQGCQQIYARSEWDAGKPEDVEFAESVIGGGVSASQWKTLAEDLISRLPPEDE